MSDSATFVPGDFTVPGELVTDSFRLVPLGPEHNDGDYRAWMSSIDHIRSTPGFQGRSWPRPEMTLAENLADLRRHAEDFASRTGFTYTVLAGGGGEIIGCVYIYPGRDEAGAEVRSWVRADRADLDVPLYQAVSGWLRAAWPFTAVNYAPRRGAMTTAATSYWPADTTEPVLETTVGGVLRAAAAAGPQMTAMVAGVPAQDARRRWTYAELLAQAERAAAALTARFAPGERVAVWAPNLPEWVILEYAAALAGLVLVTVNPALRPGELAYVLNQSGASGIFLVPQFRSPMAEFLAEARPDVPLLREVVFFTEWAEFLATAPPQAVLPEVRPDDIAQIQYTSGTTGFPKGAELHHRGLTNNARFFAERMELQPGEAYVNPMPLFHTAGCAMGVLGAAQRLVVHVPVLAFDPALVLELMEAERAAVFAGVPTMMIAMLGHPDFERRDLSSLRAAVSGGSPVPAELVRQVEARLGVRFSIVFGTTECSPLITQVRLDDSAADRAGTLGPPLPQTEVMIADVAAGGPVPVGQVGELCARGYMVMRGYHDAPEATAAAIDADGWYHSGDLASLDDRGYLRIEGRIKDMIIRGGENIYPREIEDVLFDHPAVAEAVVIGVPDPSWGEVVAAYVRPVPGQPSPAPGELRAWCRDRLAPYKTPQHWVFVDAFPMTPSGKIQKFKLRESFTANPPTS